MYRKRRKKLHRRRRAAVIAAFAAILAVAVGIPTFASGASSTDNLLGQVGSSGSGSTSGTSGSSGTVSGTAQPKSGVPPTYTPPLHGTNPHGQGFNAGVGFQAGKTKSFSGRSKKDC